MISCQITDINGKIVKETEVKIMSHGINCKGTQLWVPILTLTVQKNCTVTVQ